MSDLDAAEQAFVILFKGLDEDVLNEAFGRVFEEIGPDLIRRVVGEGWPFYTERICSAMAGVGTTGYADSSSSEECKEDLPHLIRLRDHLNELIGIAEQKAKEGVE